MRTTGVLAAVACMLVGCGSLYRVVGRVGYMVSSVRLPVTVPVPVVNKPLEPWARQRLEQAMLAFHSQGQDGAPIPYESLFETPRRPAPTGLAWVTQRSPVRWVAQPAREGLLALLDIFEEPKERFDDFGDFRREERHTVVMVCLSGGGARSAAFCRHVMAQLEQTYNKVNPRPEKDLIDSIDVYSSVSGGSIYTSHVAVGVLELAEEEARAKKPVSSPTAFQEVAERSALGTRYLGALASTVYLSPFNLFLVPVVTLVSDWTYMDLLAYTLNVSHDRRPWLLRPPRLPRLSGYRMGHLGRSPRFYFNAACLESGMPFVITQRLVHLPGETPPARPGAGRSPAPLGHAVTLEDINSSPAQFPIACAAIASAAYPILQDPVPVRKFDYVPTTKSVAKTSAVLHLTDGGVYDNTGLETAVDLFEYLVATQGVRRLVLLHISAENSDYDVHIARRMGRPFSWLRHLLPEHLCPIRGVVGGYRSLNLINYLNKRRAERAALDRLDRLCGRSPQVGYLYFPVSLAHLRPQGTEAVQDDEEVFRRVQKIQTDYTLSPTQDAYLAKAARILLTTPRAGGEPGTRPRHAWPVGPNDGGRPRAIRRLDLAFAYAVTRARLPAWGSALPATAPPQPRPPTGNQKR